MGSHSELNQFTVERLEEITELKALSFPPLHPEIAALARIALAAKRAEHSHSRREVWDGNTWVQCSKQPYDRHEAGGQRVGVLYEHPQLNSPVVPEGWKLVPIEPTDAMQFAAAQAIRFDTTNINKLWMGKRVFAAAIAAAPIYPVEGGE
ncbi:TPA: hypothetical protein ACPY56_004186 [Yersinia enterocolitica]